MARIDSLEFNIDGKVYKSNVNVNKKGIFKVELHWEVQTVLNLDYGVITGSSKSEVVNPIMKAYKNYLESKREFELCIAIKYQASGNFARYNDGSGMFDFNGKYSAQGLNKGTSRLHFGFQIYCKETNSLGNEIWHNVQLINNRENLYNYPIIGDYFVTSITYNVEGKIIPFTEKALDTLKKADGGIRSISEILFTFLNQDVEAISTQLNNGNLLKS